MEEISNKFHKRKRLMFINRSNWILPYIVRITPNSGASMFYIVPNKSGKVGYK